MTQKTMTMMHRQRGSLNLYWVGIGSVVLAGLAMAALMSMRMERNLFAEGAAKAGKAFSASPAQEVLDSAKQAAAGSDGQMRKCVIDGKTVISNAVCKDSNPTSKEIKIQVTRGVEAPKVPVEPVAERSSDPLLDKIIEKQSR